MRALFRNKMGHLNGHCVAVCGRVYRSAFLFVPRMLLLLLFVSPGLRAADYYVSTTGSPVGNGSLSSPWDFQTALSSPVIHPGDHIWLRGGTYVAPAPTGYALQVSGK